MDKENLQTKVEALQDNLRVKHDELTEVQEIGPVASSVDPFPV